MTTKEAQLLEMKLARVQAIAAWKLAWAAEARWKAAKIRLAQIEVEDTRAEMEGLSKEAYEADRIAQELVVSSGYLKEKP